MDLKLYMLFDRNENRFFSPAIGIDDKDYTSFILKQLNIAYEHIEKEEEKEPFLSKVRSCEVVRLGVINELTGELTNDKQFLLDLKDFNINVKEDNKNEI